MNVVAFSYQETYYVGGLTKFLALKVRGSNGVLKYLLFASNESKCVSIHLMHYAWH